MNDYPQKLKYHSFIEQIPNCASIHKYRTQYLLKTISTNY